MPAHAQPVSHSGSQFARTALSTLPIEEPQGFREVLKRETDRLRRAPDTKPISSEMTIPDDGWELLIASKSGMQLRQTAAVFRRYLDKSMQSG